VSPKRILVVDDEPDIVHIVTSVLKTKGYDTEVAHDGQAALDMVARRKPDMIILDLMMPVLSGLEVVRRLKRDEATRDIPLIVMSAAAKQSGKPEEFFREGLGSDDFIAKPFDPLSMLGRVEAVLRMADYQGPRAESPHPPSPSPNSGRGGGSVPHSTAKVGGATLAELPTLDPSGIVKAFIESWNNQDFAVEFQCLAPGMTGGLPQSSYVLRRQQAYADDQASERTQRLLRVVSMDAKDNTAHVVVEREDTVRGHPRTRTEEYELIRGEKNWQIRVARPVK
jgi:CheY-like chemotaxis protein